MLLKIQTKITRFIPNFRKIFYVGALSPLPGGPPPILVYVVKVEKVKNYLFMKYNKNIQNKVFQEKIFKNL